MVIFLRSFGVKALSIGISFLIVVFLCCFVYISTKDPGQKPFTFKIGQGSVIKG
ncbi:hypothetical protein CK203_051171 [Vitis vinifera]|uniref:Uncharacterized protein n=1 Tax=Vitis vinifera TaxID=29760 RepID=A0A438HEC2_VITVI|nr:hypothetical protein CK203_051171 [Vitis vinifera]